MAKNKSISSFQIITYYMEYVLKNNKQPESVFSFSKVNNFEEIKFYEHFTSFESLEQNIFKEFFDNTFSILEKNEDYQNYDSRSKLLSFYFTFFEILNNNRSYVIYSLGQHKDYLKKIKLLHKLKQRFTLFIEHLNIPVFNLKNETFQKIQSKSIKESSWLHLLYTIKFWIEDTSTSFEKTDVFIEKSVNASFDLINTQPLNGLIDLGKFLYKEKIQMN